MGAALILDRPDVRVFSDRQRREAIEKRTAWLELARPKQIPPSSEGWSVWAVITGRGFGKTRSAAEETWWWAYRNPGKIQHVIGATRGDVKLVCIEGESGLLRVMPECLIEGYHRTDLIITLKNGSIIRCFGAEEEDRLRGPQCHRMWADELASWNNGKPQATWDMAMFGLRLGSVSQALVTTTPRPSPLIRQLLASPTSVVVRGSTDENRANLSTTFYDNINKHRGTQLGRQEIDGEVLKPGENAIIVRSKIQMWPASRPLPYFDFVIVSMDTAFTEKTMDTKTGTADPTASITVGVFQYKGKYGVMLLDAWSDLLSFPELVKAARDDMKATYGMREVPILTPLVGKNTVQIQKKHPDLLVIEDKGSGISLRQTLAAEGLAAHAYNPGRADKTLRLHLVSHMVEQGMFWVPESSDTRLAGQFSSWSEAFIEELTTYSGPNTTDHDDYVDCFTQAMRVVGDQLLDGKKIPSGPLPQEEKAREEREGAEAQELVNPYAA